MQNALRVGKTTIGLVGLDMALRRAAQDNSLNESTAAEQVFAEIVSRNYVPAAARESYRKAIRLQIARLRTGNTEQNGDLVIRILGPGCVSCNNLQKLVIEIMNDIDVAADVFQVHDLDDISRFGIMRTPALVINGQVKCAGRLPTHTKTEEWLRES